jgi:DNA-binding MarR family transcriptional regulator/GNAT superfamily N-acetyltransferase
MTMLTGGSPSQGHLSKMPFSDYSQAMKQPQIDLVRRFNRAVTQRIGALDDAYLSRGRSLGLSRLVWEIQPAGTEVRLLRARLGLDSGYFSRQLRRLEADRLITIESDEGDGRVRIVRLTRKGLAERVVLDRSSNELAASILAPLTEPQRDRLVIAMADVERLLLASQVRVEITDPRDNDARYCLRSYFEELGHRFDTGFDPAQSISASDEEMTLPNGLLLVASLLGQAVGCGALKLHVDTQVAEIKRMWVASEMRGLGLGRRLLERLATEAASRGIALLRLETNRSLSEAKHLYKRAGFTEVSPFNNEPYAHHWFQKGLRHT